MHIVQNLYSHMRKRMVRIVRVFQHSKEATEELCHRLRSIVLRST